VTFTVVLLALLLAAAEPREVEVRPNETLADIARRELGDSAAEGELRALNRLGQQQVAPGTRLVLPGADRERALSALKAARNAVTQADKDAGSATEPARGRLAEAEALFSQAQYLRAAKAADEAWRLLSADKPEGTAFSVEVDAAGATTVASRRGTPVRVEAEGVQRTVGAGTSVKVARGEAPSEPTRPLPTPEPLSPKDQVRLRLKPDSKGELGPVRLTWTKAVGAERYLVEVRPAEGVGPPLQLEASRPQMTLPPLPPGSYLWTVQAIVSRAQNSERSAPRRFELEVDPLRLEVREPRWK
jgi:hypothetical protein